MSILSRNIPLLAYLFYFVFYVVSPASAALSSSLSPDAQAAEAGFSLEGLRSSGAGQAKDLRLQGRDEGGIDPLVFDMVLWKLLKNGKPADLVSGDGPVVRTAGPKDFADKGKCPMLCGLRLFPAASADLVVCGGSVLVSPGIDSLLSYSDLSPPSS